MPPVYSLALDSAAVHSMSCTGLHFVFDFLLTKCSLLTKYLHSPPLVYFNSHYFPLLLSLSLPTPSPLLLRPSNWLFIAACSDKSPASLRRDPSKTNALLSVQNRKMEGERVGDEINRVESLEQWADGESRRNKWRVGRSFKSTFFWCSSGLLSTDFTIPVFLVILPHEVLLIFLMLVCWLPFLLYYHTDTHTHVFKAWG